MGLAQWWPPLPLEPELGCRWLKVAIGTVVPLSKGQPKKGNHHRVTTVTENPFSSPQWSHLPTGTFIHCSHLPVPVLQ